MKAKNNPKRFPRDLPGSGTVHSRASLGAVPSAWMLFPQIFAGLASSWHCELSSNVSS